MLEVSGEPDGHKPFSTSQPLTLPPDSVAVLLPLLGFSANGSANPNFVAPAYPGESTDTVTAVDSTGNTFIQITRTGTYGEPKVITVIRNGVTQMIARYTWVAATGGGIRVSAANYKDLSNPNVEIRTTVSVTSANIVTLTQLERLRTHMRFAAAAPTIQRLVLAAGQACLPEQLSATMSLTPACKAAVAAMAWRFVRFALDSAAYGAAGPASLAFGLRYFGSVAAFIGSAFAVGSACKR